MDVVPDPPSVVSPLLATSVVGAELEGRTDSELVGALGTSSSPSAIEDTELGLFIRWRTNGTRSTPTEMPNMATIAIGNMAMDRDGATPRLGCWCGALLTGLSCIDSSAVTNSRAVANGRSVRLAVARRIAALTWRPSFGRSGANCVSGSVSTEITPPVVVVTI